MWVWGCCCFCFFLGGGVVCCEGFLFWGGWVGFGFFLFLFIFLCFYFGGGGGVFWGIRIQYLHFFSFVDIS